MRGFLQSAFLRRMVAALYALAVVVVGFGSTAHAGFAKPQTGVSLMASCKGEAAPQGKPTGDCSTHCVFCALSATPGLKTVFKTTLVYRFELKTRAEFAARLGRDLDASPADLRSRAPPAA
jgi:hypothetical protein